MCHYIRVLTALTFVFSSIDANVVPILILGTEISNSHKHVTNPCLADSLEEPKPLTCNHGVVDIDAI